MSNKLEISGGSFVYSLMPVKGKETFKNKFYFRVYADKDAGISEEDITSRLVACWNEHDDLVKERDELVEALREMRETWEKLKSFREMQDMFSRVDSILVKYPKEN